MKYFLAFLVLVCVALPAFGSTHIITVLGTQPLFPKTESRVQFLAVMHQYPERERIALRMLDIDQAAFERGMRSAPSMLTQAPFHLDAMAYYDGRVKVVEDVEVPTHTYLWVLHMRHKTIYVPQLCGNISTVATTGIESYHAAYPLTAQARRPVAAPTPVFPGPSAQVAQATSAPLVTPPAAPPAASHGFKFPWWIILLPVALIDASHSSSSSAPPPATTTPTPTPTPVHTPTPTPTPTGTMTPTPTPTPTRPPTPTPTPTCTCRPTPTPTPCPTKTPKPTPTPTPTKAIRLTHTS